MNMNTLLILSLIVAFLWAIPPILQKQLLSKYSKHTVFVVTVLTFATFVLLYGMHHKETLTNDIERLATNHKDLGTIVFIAFVCNFLASLLYYELIKHNSAHTVTSLTYSSPIFTIILAYIFLKEPLDTNSIIGAILVVSGVLVISQSEG